MLAPDVQLDDGLRVTKRGDNFPDTGGTFHVDHFDLLSVEAFQYFIDCILKDFDPSVYGLDAETLRSDLE